MALAVVLNLITPSRWERRLWAPAILMFATVSRFRPGNAAPEIVGANRLHATVHA